MKLSKLLRRALSSALTAAIGLTIVPSNAFINTAAADKTPEIIVDAYTDRGEVSPYLRSANHRFAYGGFGMYDIENNKVHDDFKSKNKDTKWGAVRYPGGTIANLFKWKDAIGPLEKRRNVVLGNSYLSDFPSYGVDEHMRFCEEIGAKAMYVIAEASEEPQDAADLVEYLNAPNDGSNPGGGVDWAAERAKNGHEKPYGVKYFEIGNEMHIGNQRYWMQYPSAEGENLPDLQKYAKGDTVSVPETPARKYGTWKENLSDGTAGQKFYTQYYPVVKGTQHVFVNGAEWTCADSFDSTSSDAKIYSFNEKTGEITFGDGEKGEIPEKDAQITVSYNHVHAGFAEFYKAMKAVDPSIKVVACMEKIFNAGTGITAKDCDGVAYHDYISFPENINTEQKLYDNYITISDDLVQNMQNDITELRTASKSNDTIAAVTEYGTIPIPDLAPASSDLERDEARVLARGLGFAGTYIGAVDSGIDTAVHQGYTAYSFGGGAKLPNAGNVYNSLYAQEKDDPSKTIESSMALSFKLCGNYTGKTKLDSSVADNPTVTKSKSYSALKVLATKTDEDGELYLIVVNRDPDRDITSSVKLSGFTLTGGKAQVTTLNAKTYMECNTPEHPTDVRLETVSVGLEKGGSDFAYTFPAHSVVGIKLSGTVAQHWENRFDNGGFESEAIGSLPAYMQKTTAAGTAGIGADPANGAGRCLKIVREANVNVSLKATLSGEDIAGNAKGFSDLTRIKMRVYPEQANSRLNISVVSAAGEKAANISFDSSGYMKNNLKEQRLYSAGRWYDLELILDSRSKRYYMYLDGALLTNARRDFNNSLSGPITYVTFDLDNTKGTFYIDDFSVMTSDSGIIEAVSGSELVTVLTKAGKAPKLPVQVNLIYNTGKKEAKNAAWEQIDPALYQNSGTFYVYGAVEGSDIRAQAFVKVAKAVSVKAAAVRTMVNNPPKLPQTASVVYDSGDTEDENVIWDEIKPSEYAAEGTFNVSGAVSDCGIKAQAAVTVYYTTAAKQAINMIGRIPENITFENMASALSAVNTAQTVYSKLSDEEKLSVTAERCKKITDAQQKISALQQQAQDAQAAKVVENLINALGAKPSAGQLDAARNAYNSLTPAQKKLVGNVGALLAAEKKAASANKPAVTKVKIKKGAKTVSGKKITVLKKKKTVKLKAVVTGRKLTSKLKRVKWKSDKTKIAKVSAKGTVKLKKKGTVKITATAGGKKATVTLKIK